MCRGVLAQSAIADLKFEEAETAFNDKNYETVLIKLDDFDKMFGSVTAKSLYLRIVSQDKLLNESETAFGVLVSLRKNVKSYLKAMESEGLDDKYREVYKISGKLEQLPVDDVSWMKIQADKKKEENIEKETASRLNSWELRDVGLKFGDTYNKIKSKYPVLRVTGEESEVIDGFRRYVDDATYTVIFMKNGVVNGYAYTEPISPNYNAPTNYKYSLPNTIKKMDEIVEKIKRDVGDVDVKSVSKDHGGGYLTTTYLISHRGTTTKISLSNETSGFENYYINIYPLCIMK